MWTRTIIAQAHDQSGHELVVVRIDHPDRHGPWYEVQHADGTHTIAWSPDRGVALKILRDHTWGDVSW